MIVCVVHSLIPLQGDAPDDGPAPKKGRGKAATEKPPAEEPQIDGTEEVEEEEKVEEVPEEAEKADSEKEESEEKETSADGDEEEEKVCLTL